MRHAELYIHSQVHRDRSYVIRKNPFIFIHLNLTSTALSAQATQKPVSVKKEPKSPRLAPAVTPVSGMVKQLNIFTEMVVNIFLKLYI